LGVGIVVDLVDLPVAVVDLAAVAAALVDLVVEVLAAVVLAVAGNIFMHVNFH
jgi:hypothetical protein